MVGVVGSNPIAPTNYSDAEATHGACGTAGYESERYDTAN